ncbi:hypothetical protein EV360DRAFT_73692 [Lentinula raphanica]|nr:hypothetical protein EV360DRAFT_73692 [Lentinula raphanica]
MSVNLGAQQEYKIDVKFVIMGPGEGSEGKKGEHWMLVLGNIFVHAAISIHVDKSHLSIFLLLPGAAVHSQDAAKYSHKRKLESWDPNYPPHDHKEIHLGEGRFKDANEFDEVIDNMLYETQTLGLVFPHSPTVKPESGEIFLQLPKPIREKGGNCMDLIRLVIDYLDRHGHFVGVGVKEKFEEEYRRRYHAVAKKTLDLDLQP